MYFLTESIFNSLPPQKKYKVSGLNGFTGKFYQTLKKKYINSLPKNRNKK